MRWQYKTIRYHIGQHAMGVDRDRDLEAKLNELGAEEWEVCGMVDATIESERVGSTLEVLLKQPT